MRRVISVVCLGAVLSIGAAVAVPSLAAAAGGTTVCNGHLKPGTYGRVVVPADAVCLSRGPVRILAGLWIESGATFVLGSEQSGWTTGTIDDGVHATDPASVQIHFA